MTETLMASAQEGMQTLSSLRGVSDSKTSPLAAGAPAPVSPFDSEQPRDTIISVTPTALAKLKELRSTEPDAEKLGLRLSIISGPGEDFRYDLVFEEFLKSAFTDEVRTIDGFKFIMPGGDVDSLRGSELDYNEQAGLVLRNPNRPKAPVVEGLVRDDETSAQIEAIVSVDVNPMLAAHGGFVTFAGHDTQGTAYFTMGGGCHGCSMSKQTMLEGVQKIITDQVGTITHVRDLTDHATGANPYYR
ncbi:MAG: NifU family protein [Ilumatobacteraceae bacterium]